MKKIVMFVYGDITTDARVQRAASTLSASYEVILISNNWGKEVQDTSYKNVLVGRDGYDSRNYFNTIREVLRIVKQEKPFIFYGHDYYSALAIRFLLGRKYCKKIVYDAHELYVPQPGLHFTVRSRFFYAIEKSIVKKVDLLICASRERAEKMQQHYGLNKTPVTIRNISQLWISHDETTETIMSSLDSFFSKPGITVVYAGVVMGSRRIDELASIVSKRPEKYKLLIVGKGDALDRVKQIADSVPTLTSAFTGAVPYRSLGAILSKSDIGFIYYPVNTLNNIYCASNKLYEYASVNLPILANENPTIKKELELGLMGVATNDLERGLEKISANINQYKEACKLFTANNRWEDESKILEKAIMEIK